MVSVGFVTAPSWADVQILTCGSCHSAELNHLSASVHSAIGCQECHGGAERYEVTEAEAQRFQSRTPNSGSVFDHGPTFHGPAAKSEIPNLCGDCHADAQHMNPYGLRIDQLARYWTSRHGQSLREKGDENVAVCTDCHGNHDVLPGRDPASLTHPLNVPATCGRCHADSALMSHYDLPVEVVEEYRASVHGKLLFEQGDVGAPTCATCHGNHSATPPGFATVGAVCGQCHQHASLNFASSIHAKLPEHKGCVQCHGGGEDRHDHLIERITKPTGVLIERYAHLLTIDPTPSAQRITDEINPDPKAIINRSLSTCLQCHEDIEDDESLPKLFVLLDSIADAERVYVQTAQRLNEMEKGVYLVDRARFKFEDATTHLIELAPLQHTLDNSLVSGKVAELHAVCDQVNLDLDDLERELGLRKAALIPLWLFASVFSAALYVKYRRLKSELVMPLSDHSHR